jgi:hypothetical protein
MAISEVDSGGLARGEQVANGFQTGSCAPKMAALIAHEAAGWRETGAHVALLRALCALTQEKPEQAEKGFTPMDIALALKKFGASPLPADGTGVDKSEVARKIREQWKKLAALWEQKQVGLGQLAESHGLGVIPLIDREEGGGTGKPTRYWIGYRAAEATRDPEAAETVPELRPGEIRYICEDIADAGRLSRIFTKGYEISGWRRGVFLVALIAIILAALLLFLLADLVFMTRPPLKDLFYFLSGLSGIGWIIWSSFAPFLQVMDWRIVEAPDWMQSDITQSDRLLEWRCPPRYPEKMYKAVRYTAKCPVCEGKVVACSGGREFFKRIVGRCEESPREHVFSFDHITRTGRELRPK